MTQLQVRSLVRRQLLYYLAEALKGDELLMKEVWEDCETDDQVDAAKREIAEVVELLQDRERRMSEGV